MKKLILLLWLMSMQAFAQVGIDTGSITSNSNDATSSLSTSVTVAAGSNLVMTAGVCTNVKTDLACAYNGDALTEINTAGSATTVNATLFRLINPDVGTANLVCTHTVPIRMVVGTVTFTGAHQTTPIRDSDQVTAASGTSQTRTLDSAVGDYAIETSCVGDSADPVDVIPGTDQTQRWEATVAGDRHGFGSTEAPAGASVTMSNSWTNSADNAIAAAVIAPASAGSATVHAYYR